MQVTITCWITVLLLAAAAANAAVLVQDQQQQVRSCAQGRESSVQEALDKLFTCLLDTQIRSSWAFKQAARINYGGIAGNGVTQRPLLTRVFSTRQLLSDKFGNSYKQFLEVVDAFNPVLGVNETRRSTEMGRINKYLRFLEGSSMISDTFMTLRANGALNSVSSVSKFVRNTLWDQWFELYGRSSKSHAAGLRESSGFGHVLVGERRQSKVTGFHSWVQLLAEEEQGDIQYKGYFRTVSEPLPAAGIQFGWYDGVKTMSSFAFGVPPEFELAIFASSFVTQPGRKATFTIAGSKLPVQTFTVTHQPSSVGTAYIAV